MLEMEFEVVSVKDEVKKDPKDEVKKFTRVVLKHKKSSMAVEITARLEITSTDKEIKKGFPILERVNVTVHPLQTLDKFTEEEA